MAEGHRKGDTFAAFFFLSESVYRKRHDTP